MTQEDWKQPVHMPPGLSFKGYKSEPVMTPQSHIVHQEPEIMAPPINQPVNTTTLLWKEAHEYAMAHEDNWDEAATRLWYQAWVKRIPKFGCGCQDHWAAITRSNPPQFESPMAFFTWFWARHDEVSRTQSKKPELTLDEAFRIWWPKYADQQNLSTSE